MKLKLLSFLIAIIFIFLLTACEKQNIQSSSGTSSVVAESSSLPEVFSTISKPENYSISFMPMDESDEYWKEMQSGCEQAVKKLEEDGINIDFSVDIGKYRQSENMSDVINKVIAKNKDAILITPTGSYIIEDFVKARELGIKIIILETELDGDDWDAAYYRDYYNDGKLAGEKMLEDLTSRGITSGKIGLIGMNKSVEPTSKREDGFKSAFENKGYEILETKYCDGKPIESKEATEELINEDEVIGIFGSMGGSAAGVAIAVQETDKAEYISVIGCDMSNYFFETNDYDSVDMEKLISSGVVYAAIKSDPYKMGYEAMMETIKALRGEEINPKTTYIPPIVVTKENVEEYF